MKNKRLLTGAIALTLVFAQAVPAGADTIDSLKQQKAENTKKLSELQSSIDDLEDKKTEITGKIDSMDAQLVTTIASIDSLTDQIAEQEKQIEETTVKLEAAQEKKATEYSAMKKRIQYIYENGGDAGWATILLQDSNVSDLLNEAEYTNKMYKYDRECLEEYGEIVQEVTDLKEEQEDQKAESETMKEEQEAQKSNLENLLEEAKATSADYDKQIQSATKKAADYQKLIQQQNEKIQELVAQQEAERKAAEEAARKQAAAEKAARKAAAARKSNSSKKSSSSASDSEDIVSSGSGSATGQEIVNYALQFVGNPYVWGGNSLTNGTDCSGFVHLIYAHFGYSVPRQSASLRSAGRGVSYSEAQPGDIICYNGHVAIYMGGGQIVHAASTKTGIKTSPNAAYRQILAVRRIV